MNMVGGILMIFLQNIMKKILKNIIVADFGVINESCFPIHSATICPLYR